jgi:hypothetical protein
MAAIGIGLLTGLNVSQAQLVSFTTWPPDTPSALVATSSGAARP